MGFTSMKLPRQKRLDKQVFWDRAKEVARQVVKGVENQHEKIGFDILAYITEQIQFEDLVQLSREIGLHEHFGLSNLGKCSPGPELDASAERVVDATEIYFALHGNGSETSDIHSLSQL
eukprot:gene7022-12647_t